MPDLWRKISNHDGQAFTHWQFMPVPIVVLEDANGRGMYRVQYADIVPIPLPPQDKKPK